jgi:hypothetical protein
MFCRNSKGVRRWQASSTKWAPFQRAFAEQDAVVRQDRDRHAPDAGEAADQGRAVELLELVQLGAVDDAGDHLAHVIGRADIVGDDAVQLVRVELSGGTGSARSMSIGLVVFSRATMLRTIESACSSLSAR